jgi:hypothetical protein
VEAGWGGGGVIPVEQTITVPPRGDCFGACVASILELPIGDVPNPAPEEHWWDAWNEWLLLRGLQLVQWEAPEGDRPDGHRVCCRLSGYWIATVPSLNAQADPAKPATWGRHCIVMNGDSVAWDPSPGIKRTDENWPEGDRIFEVTALLPLNPLQTAKEAATSCQEGSP